jgi:hypothetical protein
MLCNTIRYGKLAPEIGSPYPLVTNNFMPILVACPSCGKRFKAGNKYAGKTGLCPNCKQPIKVPAKRKEVIIQAPEEFEQGGRSINGELIIKPVEWRETKFNPKTAATIAGQALMIFAAALIGGK